MSNSRSIQWTGSFHTVMQGRTYGFCLITNGRFFSLWDLAWRSPWLLPRSDLWVYARFASPPYMRRASHYRPLLRPSCITSHFLDLRLCEEIVAYLSSLCCGSTVLIHRKIPGDCCWQTLSQGGSTFTWLPVADTGSQSKLATSSAQTPHVTAVETRNNLLRPR